MGSFHAFRALVSARALFLFALAIPCSASSQTLAQEFMGPAPIPGSPASRDRLIGPAGVATVDGFWSELVIRSRVGHTAIYDPVRDRMVVFGGTDGVKRNDVWVLSLAEPPEWIELVTTGTPPSARDNHSAIYDPVRDRMVVFGGTDDITGQLDDVWTLSLSGTPTWTPLTPSGTPPSARERHSAIYDPVRDRMLIIGGIAPGATADVWALSLAGTPAWTELTPTGTPPNARVNQSAIYDPVRDRMVVFGGYDYTVRNNDVWALSLAGTPAWTELTPGGTPPSARDSHSAIYDPVRDRMVVFGGNGQPSGLLGDVWTLSLAISPTWTALAPGGTPPSARQGSSAIFDSVRDRLVLFGGHDGGYRNDVYGLTLAGAPVWATTLPQVTPPPGRLSPAVIRDPVRDRIVVFGGFGGTSLNDAWALPLADTPVWAQLTPSGTPPDARVNHSMINDPVRDRTVMFGGYNGTSTFFNDVWTLSLAGTPIWALLTPSGTPPSGRYGQSAIYDPVRDRMLVFGGVNTISLFDEVWALSLAGTPAWTQLTPTGGGLHLAREGHSAIYDPVRDRLVVFGGTETFPRNDVWALSLAGTPSWTQLTPTGTPPVARTYHSAIYDPIRDRMVIFAGSNASSLRKDAWALSLAGTPAWTQLTPTGPPVFARQAHGAIYDPARDRMVVFGGSGDGTNLNDTWALTWDAPATAGVTCPGDVAWVPGASSSIGYTVTNPYAFGQSADYTLTSAREWPGFPIRGSVMVGASGSVPVSVVAPVPDTAAVGLNLLTFGVTLRGVPEYAQCEHNLHDATTPVLMSLMSAEANPDLVRLIWYDGSREAREATVYRTLPDGDGWSSRARVTSDLSGRIVYEDRDVTPGHRYGYRLGVAERGSETFLGEAWVDVPSAARFALTGARPNPASQELVVTFSLPDATPARLEVFDLAGRRVTSRDVGVLGAGNHLVRLGDAQPLAAGLYLLRLTRGDRKLEARAIVLR